MSKRFKLDEDFMYDRGYDVSYTYLGEDKISTTYESGSLEIEVYENKDEILVNMFEHEGLLDESELERLEFFNDVELW